MQATPYHRQVCDYLEHREPELWRWVAAAREQDANELRLQLLKSTYLLDPAAHPAPYAAAARAAATLGISPTVRLYQAHRADGCNVAVWVVDQEAHVIFQGGALDLLAEEELVAVLGHELAHFRLWQEDGQRFWIGHQLLQRLAAEEGSAGVWTHTATRYQQYTELYADRGALRAAGGPLPAIAGLVKLETSLRQVHPESFLQQADAILAAGDDAADGHSHPQSYVRAKALQLQATGAPDADAVIDRLLRGSLDLDRSDILDQLALTALTRSVLARLLARPWFASDSVRALARRYFEDFTPGESPRAEHLDADGQLRLPPGHRLHDYLCFVLLDFARVDPALEELPLLAAWRLAVELDLAGAFEQHLLKETKVKKTAFAKLKQQAEALLAEAEKAAPTLP